MNTKLWVLLAILGFATMTSAQPVPDYVPTNGLVGWWPFTGNANDISGNGRHGSVNGAVLTNDRTGASNTAYYFDGFNDLISVAPPNVSFANGVTVSVWCKLVQSSGNSQFLVSRGNDNMVGHFHVQFNQQTFPQHFGGGINQWFNTPGVYSTGTFPTPHNGWHHVVYTFDNNTESLYVDCNLVAELSFSTQIGSNSSPIHFGNGYDVFNSTYRARGNLDDIGIWNRALSKEEVKTLYYQTAWNSNTEISQTSCDSYTWPATGQTYTQSGTYTQSLIGACGCDSTVTLNLTIQDVITVFIADTICEGQTYTLPDGIEVNSGGTYTSTLSTVNNCDSIITVQLVEIQAPSSLEVFIVPNPAITVEGVPIRLNVVSNQTPPLQYEWSPADGLSCSDCRDPEFNGVRTNNYQVTITDANGCTAFASTNVEVLENYPIYIPNAFSPNGDNINDVWEILGNKDAIERWEIQIFDRWGELVFKSEDLDFQWNGMFREKPIHIGVYTYVLKIIGRHQTSSKLYTGPITVVR
jgi:gliding motility-associated-like protein